MVNYKAYKITNKIPVGTSFNVVIFELDKYIDLGWHYGEEVKGRGHISCVDHHPYSGYEAGDWLEIDLDRIGEKNGSGAFDDTSIVRKVGSTAVVPSSSDEIVSRNNNNLASVSQSQASGAIQMLNRAIDSDERNRYTASIEVDPRTGNAIYKLSGERK